MRQSSAAAFLRFSLFALPLFFPTFAGADCIPFADARNHIGETRCVTGKVMRVEPGSRGLHFLDFCEDYRVCPFTVVIFPRDLRNVGDVRQLQGKVIEVHGRVKEYDGRAEIVLQQARQLSGEASRIPPLPKNYDVETKGRYSAGKFSYPSRTHKRKRKKQPAPVRTEEPDDAADEP